MNSIKVYFKQYHDEDYIEIEKEKDGNYEISLYGFCELGYSYGITKEKLIELRDKLTELIENG